MWTPILILLTTPCHQDPAAVPAAASPAQQAWDKLQTRLAAAQGLNLSAHMVLSDPSIPPDEMATIAMDLQLHLARPSAGHAVWTTVFGEGEDADTVRLEWLGTGAKVFAVDHEEKWASAEGEEWKESELGFFLPFLGPTWSVSSVQAKQITGLPPLPGHPDWQGLKILGAADEEDPEAGSVELQIWLGADGLCRRAITSVGGTAILEFEISEMELAEKVDLEQYRTTIPEGYTVLDEDVSEESAEAEASPLEASLLPVGTPAPDALLLGMDDVELTLSSLRGKTVLLNFWFFH